MSVSKAFKEKIEALTEEDQGRLIRMGWEDRTTFEAIEYQFGLTPNEFVKFMRMRLETAAFKLWRKRIFEQGTLKNSLKRNTRVTRFKCSRQSVDGITKGYK